MPAVMTTADVAAQQDALRPLRNFINTLSGVLSDQSIAGQDGYATNPTYQYQTIGANSVSIEGAPVNLSGGGSVSLSSNTVTLLLIAAVAYLVLK